MRRRTWLLAAITFACRADEATDLLETLEPLVSALSDGDARAFMRRIPEGMKDREQLATNVSALVQQAELTSSVEVADASRGQVNWYLEIRSRATRMIIERRQRVLTVEVEKRKIRSLTPVDFFVPAEVRQR